jgi:adenosylcobinamide amidohydrolase
VIDPELRRDPAPTLVWRLPAPLLCISSAPVGGGLGVRGWVLNAEVPLDYERHDLDAHVSELAEAAGLAGLGVGVGMLTAAAIDRWTAGDDGGVRSWATVGLSKPTWAAGADDTPARWQPGTVNIVAMLPARLDDAALVNTVMTVTEAKAQALFEAGVPGTGTASDAVCVACPATGPAESFGGPRSAWGSRLARAVHAAVANGVSPSDRGGAKPPPRRPAP